MKLIIDTTEGRLTTIDGDQERCLSLYSPESFHLINQQWLKVGWTQKYTYGFTWLGRPIIQLPEDLLRIQECIVHLQPDVIIETGVAHGGSLVFYASLCKLLDRGRVIGVDIEIRPHNRRAIESHPLASLITLIEGGSTDADTIQRVGRHIHPGEKVLVILDSCHTRDHVLDELRSYSDFVTVGSYLVATDGIMELVAGAPRANPEWAWNNPSQAAFLFARERQDFVLQEPPQPFNEGHITERVTHWPNAFLKRVA